MKSLSIETQRELVELLKGLEWSDYDELDNPICPSCQCAEHDGIHELDCKIDLVLAKARAEGGEDA